MSDEARRPPARSRSQLFLKKHRSVLFAYLILLVVLVLFAVNQNDFLTRYGPQSIFNQVITLCIVAFSQTLVILIGGIDLSVGAMVGLTNALAATVMSPLIRAAGAGAGGELAGIAATALVVLLVGAGCGLVNGAIVVYGRLQPIIVTLATASVFTGIAMYIRPSPGGVVSSGFARALSGRLFDYLPASALVLLFLIVFVWLPLRRTKLGQSLYAVGGNELSSFLSGIKVYRTKMITYGLSGLLCGCAGLVLTAQTASGDPIGSSKFTLDSVAAVVLGGAALSGGRGTYVGSVAGSFILSLILGLLIFWGVPSFYQAAVEGAILIIALAFAFIQSGRGRAGST
jgi:ribose transport system permease protein